MGLKATSIKRYTIEYGPNSGFNYDAGTLATIIMAFCSDYNLGLHDDSDNFSYEGLWEIDKEEFRKMTEALEKMDKAEFDRKMKFWYMGDDRTPYDKDYVVEMFKGYLADTQDDSCYVRLAWL